MPESKFSQVPQAIVCHACGGDPRASASCHVCKGAGVGISTNDGFLVWNVAIDEIIIVLRKLRIKVNAIFHLTILSLIILFFGLFLAFTIRDFTYTDIQTLAFWTSGYWFTTLFYLAITLGAFFIFRLVEFTAPAKTLPGYLPDASKNKQKNSAVTTIEVAPYFSPDAMEIVESAYRLAKDLHIVEITPEVLFASVLISKSGGLFIARLNMDFEAVKEPLVRLLLLGSSGKPPISFSREAKRVLVSAFDLANRTGRKYVTPMEVFLQSYLESEKLQDLIDRLGYPKAHIINVAEWILLQERLREDQRRFAELARFKPKSGMNRAMTAIQTSILDHFSEDLTLLARQGYLPQLVGNENVIENMLRGLESGQNSVVLVGEQGVGKAALVEQLARLMVMEQVPEILFDKRLVSVNLAQVVATGDPGLAAERLITMLHEVAVSGNIVLALYGIEALVGSGMGPMDLAETFASEIEKGHFQVIATTTPETWTRYLERRRLGKIMVRVDIPHPDAEQTIRVLMAKSGQIEYKNRVFISYSALEKATTLSLRYLHDVAPPQNALNVLRETSVLVRKTKGEGAVVADSDVAKVIHDKTSIPVEMVTKEESDKLMNLEDRMHGRVIGQDEAVIAVSRAIRRARAELREGKRPIANFLFLGPTGVGKTETAKTLAKEYFGDDNAMIRLDMSEYQEQSSINRMIGISGDERGGLLTEAVRKRPFTIVLLDEIEKAHPEILTLFLQVMDDGRLTDGVGRTIDFTNTIVIMTSNAGTSYIQSAVSQGESIDKIKTILMERELKTYFRPEFLNRFDSVIIFKPLTRDEIVQIAWLMLNSVAKALEAKSINFRASDIAVEKLADMGFDPAFGARPMRRVIQDKVETPLADIILKNEVARHDTVMLNDDGELTVKKATNIY